MRSAVGKLAIAVLATFALLGVLALPAGAQIAYAPCADGNNFACGHLTVPLDPSGAVPGTVTLALRRHRAAVGEARDAIVALAGGPGQPAIPFAEDFAELLGPIAATRDLIVLDQRGIGLSEPLSCHAFEHLSAFHSQGALVAACASQLGANRAFYTTADTVADIEAIRVAGDYEKLVLYGTSYGTKVAERYAQEYPAHVEALVLDSVVPPTGPEALDRSTFAAIPRVLRQICAKHLCAHITPEPVADLRRVVARMRRAPLRGRAIDGHGGAHPVAISSNELLGMLVQGDFSSLLRAEFVTAVRSAANGDTAPLARLLVHASGGGGESEDFDTPLYYATVCEEENFPWSRAASPKARIAQATAAARALGADAFAPFTLANALDFSDVTECAYWPYSTPAPAPEQASMPNVPTLILSGADDLRTPTANAREVAAQIPDAHLLVVPNTGHSVLGGEPGSCAREGLQAMFAGHPVKPCSAEPPPLSLRPPPLPPTSIAQVAPTQGNRGLPGRTLQAVALTLGDFERQFALQLGEAGGGAGILALNNLSSGGLRGGWAALVKGTFVFHGYSYVPGLTISGSMRTGAIDLHIGGAAAAHGTLRLGPREALVGTLGGRGVHLLPSHTARIAIVGDNAQGSPHVGPRDAAARAALRLLAGDLGGFLQP